MTASLSTLTTLQALSVSVVVSGGTGNPVATGSVTLTSGSYISPAVALSNGSATVLVPAESLPAGSDILTVTYMPDAASSAIYSTATQTATVTVTAANGTGAATVTLKPSAAAVTDQQQMTIDVSAAGPSGQPIPTGSIVLTSGSYTSQQSLSSGAAGFQIPGGTFSVGSVIFTASYSGDASYAAASGQTAITISPVVMNAQTPSPILRETVQHRKLTFWPAAMPAL